jgi:hypothetical protein
MIAVPFAEILAKKAHEIGALIRPTPGAAGEPFPRQAMAGSPAVCGAFTLPEESFSSSFPWCTQVSLRLPGPGKALPAGLPQGRAVLQRRQRLPDFAAPVGAASRQRRFARRRQSACFGSTSPAESVPPRPTAGLSGSPASGPPRRRHRSIPRADRSGPPGDAFGSSSSRPASQLPLYSGHSGGERRWRTGADGLILAHAASSTLNIQSGVSMCWPVAGRDRTSKEASSISRAKLAPRRSSLARSWNVSP